MNKTILVIGSVTAKQYEPARIDALAEGHKPKIKRVTIDELFSNHEDLVYYYGSEEGHLEYWSPEFHKVYDQATDEIPNDELFHQLAKKHLATYGDIYAVVMDESAWDQWGYRHEVAGEMLKGSNINRWVVINGRAEFIG